MVFRRYSGGTRSGIRRAKSTCEKRPRSPAAHVAPALRRACGLSRRLLAPPRWSVLRPAHPSALTRSGQTSPSAGVQPRRGRPVRCSGPHEAALRPSAPPRHSRRPLRSRRLSRVRPDQTGGGPAAPGRLPVAPQPPREPRPSLRLGPWRRVGAPAPLRSGLRLRSLCSLRPGPRRPGARGVRALALASQGGKSARDHPVPSDRRNGRRGGRSSSCRPTLPAAPTVAAEQALLSPRLALRSLALPARRVAPCPTPRGPRSAPSSLHCDHEPPLA